MKKPVELVVFDIAGTTVKDGGEIAQALQSALQAFGYDVPQEAIRPLMGYNKAHAISLILEEHENDPDQIHDRYVQKIHQRFLELMLHHYCNTSCPSPLPNAEEVFFRLKQKDIKVGLNTGFSSDITDVIIERLGWLKNELVDYVVTSSDVTAGRPYPFMIREIMMQANVPDARKVVKVGDTKADVFEGRMAGCLYSIGITTGAYSRKELQVYEPSHIIDDLKELIPIVDPDRVKA